VHEPWDISSQLAARRRALGLTLAQLARRADTSPATLSRYENGWARFEISTLRKLARALECDLVVRLEPRRRNTGKSSREAVIKTLRRLFWDQRLTPRRFEDNPAWVVERVLEYGSLDDLSRLIGWMGREAFLDQVSRARFSSDKTRAFWQQMLAREGIPCARRFSREEAATSWRNSAR
jgi:transcriptional regulator with XRE-family HTH domain